MATTQTFHYEYILPGQIEKPVGYVSARSWSDASRRVFKKHGVKESEIKVIDTTTNAGIFVPRKSEARKMYSAPLQVRYDRDGLMTD